MLLEGLRVEFSPLVVCLIPSTTLRSSIQEGEKSNYFFEVDPLVKEHENPHYTLKEIFANTFKIN